MGNLANVAYIRSLKCCQPQAGHIYGQHNNALTELHIMLSLPTTLPGLGGACSLQRKLSLMIFG